MRGCGATVQVFTPEQTTTLGAAIDAGLEHSGLSVLLFRGPCPRYLSGA